MKLRDNVSTVSGGIAAKGQKHTHVRKALQEIKTEYGEKYPVFAGNDFLSASGKPKSNGKFIKTAGMCLYNAPINVYSHDI